MFLCFSVRVLWSRCHFCCGRVAGGPEGWKVNWTTVSGDAWELVGAANFAEYYINSRNILPPGYSLVRIIVLLHGAELHELTVACFVKYRL